MTGRGFIARKAVLVEDFNLAEAGCHGKHRFQSPQDARKAIHPHKDKQIGPYRCPTCNGFHLGARKTRRLIRGRG